MERMVSFQKNTKKRYLMGKPANKTGFQIQMHGNLPIIIQPGNVILLMDLFHNMKGA